MTDYRRLVFYEFTTASGIIVNNEMLGMLYRNHIYIVKAEDMQKFILPIIFLTLGGCNAIAPISDLPSQGISKQPLLECVKEPLSENEKRFIGEWEYIQTNVNYGKEIHARVVLILRADRSARVFRQVLSKSTWREVTTSQSQWYYDKEKPILWTTNRLDGYEGKMGYNAFWQNNVLCVDDTNEVDTLRPRTATIPEYDSKGPNQALQGIADRAP
jgi:hypothetical protein